MKNKKELSEVVWAIWSDFDKNNPTSEFISFVNDLINNNGFKYADDEILVSRLLDKSQEQEVARFTDAGIYVDEWLFDNICRLNQHPSDTKYYIDLAIV